jgi:organic radical activating enzyme
MAKNKTDIRYILNTHNALELTWIMNNICTNSCRYCPPVLWAGKNHHYEWEKAKSFLQRLMAAHKKIICSISGGEPTVSPFFPDVVKMMYENGHHIQVTTNGARTINYWRKIAPMIENISWSYHAAMMDEADEDAWIEKVVECHTMSNCGIRVMMDSDNWERCVNFCKKIEKTGGARYEVVRIYSEQAKATNIGETYTEEMENWLSSHGNLYVPPSEGLRELKKYGKREELRQKIIVSKKDGTVLEDHHVNLNDIVLTNNNVFTGWSCNIGLESLFVHFDGYVKKGNCLEGGNLFHIDEHEKYELPNTGEICTRSRCMCTTDVKISKSPMFDPESEYFKNTFNTFNDNEYESDYTILRQKENLSSLKKKDIIAVKEIT